MQRVVKERFLGFLTSLILSVFGFLALFYFASFPTQADIQKINLALNNKVEKPDINVINKKLDKVIAILCFKDKDICRGVNDR